MRHNAVMKGLDYIRVVLMKPSHPAQYRRMRARHGKP